MHRIIDIHCHPAFFEPICSNQNVLERRQKVYGLYKAGIAPIQHIYNQMNAAGIEKIALLPLDLTTKRGFEVIRNEEIAQLVNLDPSRFIGFGSVDPFRTGALEILDKAFSEYNFFGLKLNPSSQQFDPRDARLEAIYQLCIQHDRPIIFHCGMSLEPNALMHFSHPMNFEPVAAAYPNLRICLAHFGFPWVRETACLMLKYPNLYADTGLLYFDSALEFYTEIFQKQLGSHWIDRSLRHQVMFGSNNPRFEQIRMVDALQKLGWRESTLDLVFSENAQVFLGKQV